ncbi:MAG: DUF2807 domain-containing protein [Flavobacteriales bacterium]|nr:DUF2807 domain-containing protein [Flavobacteriales bacterium]
MRQISLIPVLAMLFLTSCKYTTGEGPVVERTMVVDSFSGVELDGSFGVRVEQGTVQNVVAVGQENIIDKLRMNVLDGVMYLSLEPGNYLNYELEVRITVPDLNLVRLLGSGDVKLGTFVGLDELQIELDGSGDIKTMDESVLESTQKMSIELEGSGDVELKVKAHDLISVLDGSGDIELEGFAKTFEAELDGSGDIKAYDIETINCSASLDGSGSIRVNASKNLKAAVSGSGDIKYKGEPKVEASIDGSGTISAK